MNRGEWLQHMLQDLGANDEVKRPIRQKRIGLTDISNPARARLRINVQLLDCYGRGEERPSSFMHLRRNVEQARCSVAVLLADAIEKSRDVLANQTQMLDVLRADGVRFLDI